MSRVRGTNTGPEKLVRRLVSGLGYRYRLHGKGLPGRPDLVFKARKKVIFVHGCFWHSHGCGDDRPPKSKLEFWRGKLLENKKRDRRAVAALRSQGWTCLTVWACDLNHPARATEKIEKFLGR